MSDEEITEAETLWLLRAKLPRKLAVGVAKAQSARQAQVEKAGDAAIDPGCAHCSQAISRALRRHKPWSRRLGVWSRRSDSTSRN